MTKTAKAKAKLHSALNWIVENGEVIALVLIFTIACVKAFVESDEKPRSEAESAFVSSVLGDVVMARFFSDTIGLFL
jgi:hypothetical protein